MTLDSSERADREDRAETGDAPVNPDKVANSTGPVDRGDPLDDLTEGVSTASVPDRVIFAARGRLIGKWDSVDLDRLLVGVVAEVSDGTPEGRWRVPIDS